MKAKLFASYETYLKWEKENELTIKIQDFKIEQGYIVVYYIQKKEMIS